MEPQKIGFDWAVPTKGLAQRSWTIPTLVGLLVAWAEQNVAFLVDLTPDAVDPYVPLVVATIVGVWRHFFGSAKSQSVSAKVVYDSPGNMVPVRRDGTVLEP